MHTLNSHKREGGKLLPVFVWENIDGIQDVCDSGRFELPKLIDVLNVQYVYVITGYEQHLRLGTLYFSIDILFPWFDVLWVRPCAIDIL